MMRTLVAIACCLSGIAQASDIRLDFDVYLDDQRVGFHRVIVNKAVDKKRVQVEANFDIKFLTFTAYKYRHRADETWSNNCIVELDTTTNDNGKLLTVEAQSAPTGLRVMTPDESEYIDGCVRTFAYWDPVLLQSQRLLNTQTGEYELASLSRVDDTPLVFKGQEYGATRYQLRVEDKADIQLWYTPDNRWEALQTEVAGGKILRYVRKET